MSTRLIRVYSFRVSSSEPGLRSPRIGDSILPVCSIDCRSRPLLRSGKILNRRPAKSIPSICSLKRPKFGAESRPSVRFCQISPVYVFLWTGSAASWPFGLTVFSTSDIATITNIIIILQLTAQKLSETEECLPAGLFELQATDVKFKRHVGDSRLGQSSNSTLLLCDLKLQRASMPYK
jgi:hypothetical protein